MQARIVRQHFVNGERARKYRIVAGISDEPARRGIGDAHSPHAHLSGPRFHRARRYTEQPRLPRPCRPDQPRNLAGQQREGDGAEPVATDVGQRQSIVGHR